MLPRSDIGRTLAFSAAVCVVCAVLVSTSAVALKSRQQANAELDRRRNVLSAAGVVQADEDVAADEIERRFADFEVAAVDMRTGREDPAFTAAGYDARRAQGDPQASGQAPSNSAGVTRVPHYQLVYKKLDAQGRPDLVILPIEGKGLWSTLYGFIALGPDLSTVRGLTYYQHGETPGLGGEVDNPTWKARWPGRQAFDEEGRPSIEVIRGPAGPPESDPYRVDGISGATITSRSVSNMLQFWLGADGFGPYLDTLRTEGSRGQVQ